MKLILIACLLTACVDPSAEPTKSVVHDTRSTLAASTLEQAESQPAPATDVCDVLVAAPAGEADCCAALLGCSPDPIPDSCRLSQFCVDYVCHTTDGGLVRTGICTP